MRGRAEQAREQGVPAYVIFHDATLREIATVWPTSVGQLGEISGVGEKKLATYGEGVIGVLAALGEAPEGVRRGIGGDTGWGSCWSRGCGSGAGTGGSACNWAGGEGC